MTNEKIIEEQLGTPELIESDKKIAKDPRIPIIPEVEKMAERLNG